MVGGTEVTGLKLPRQRINSFVDDVCLQYPHCSDEDQQSQTVQLPTVKFRAETNTSSTRLPGSSKYPKYPIASIQIR